MRSLFLPFPKPHSEFQSGTRSCVTSSIGPCKVSQVALTLSPAALLITELVPGRLTKKATCNTNTNRNQQTSPQTVLLPKFLDSERRGGRVQPASASDAAGWFSMDLGQAEVQHPSRCTCCTKCQARRCLRAANTKLRLQH